MPLIKTEFFTVINRFSGALSIKTKKRNEIPKENWSIFHASAVQTPIPATLNMTAYQLRPINRKDNC